MSSYHMLIIDDQQDVRRVLHAGIETLGHDIQIIDVPSGEEAILIASHQPIDLFVVDIRLPGITGLELMERARDRNPDAKFILITGVPDPKIRQEVASANAEAYFFKPIEIPDFLDAVEACLGLEGAQTLESEEVDLTGEFDERPQNLSERLSGIHKEFEAQCAVLLDDCGQIMAQAGTLPKIAQEPSFVSALMATFSAATKVSYSLGADIPKDLLYFGGPESDFFLSHVGQSMALLLVMDRSVREDEQVRRLMRLIPVAVQDFLIILAEMGVPTDEEMGKQSTETVSELQEGLDDETLLTELEAIFDQVQQDELKSNDVDTFWDTAVANGSDEVTSADVISYDQARKLGLAPEDE